MPASKPSMLPSLGTTIPCKAKPERTVAGKWEVSLYHPEPATEMEIKQLIAPLMMVFSEQDPQFWGLLIQRITANRLSAERLKAAVLHVIDTHRYPRITPADILAHDKRVRLYTHFEMVKAIHSYESSPDDFEKWYSDNGKCFWVFNEQMK
jgi:hypothetical protein